MLTLFNTEWLNFISRR